jgi:signal transduction histidine kinase
MSSSFDVQVVNDVKLLIEEAVKHTRLLTINLSPAILYEFGLEPAIERLLDQIANRSNIISSFKSDGKIKLMENDVCITLYRAVSETITNVVKHAQAKHLNISTEEKGNKIQIQIKDDGKGFDVDAYFQNFLISEKAGFGLFNIRERLSQLGGYLNIYSKTGQGTKIILTAPIAAKKGNRKKRKERDGH